MIQCVICNDESRVYVVEIVDGDTGIVAALLALHPWAGVITLQEDRGLLTIIAGYDGYTFHYR